MPARLVLWFLMIRGYLGSITSVAARTFMGESTSLRDHLYRHGFNKGPGTTTILENINAVSETTRTLILEKELEWVLQEGLDEFDELTIDSTAVWANSAWPTDSRMILGLLSRAHRVGQSLDAFGLRPCRRGWMDRWLREMKTLDFELDMAGKKKAKLHQGYRKFLRREGKALGHLEQERDRVGDEVVARLQSVAPSVAQVLERTWKRMGMDVAAARKQIDLTRERVFEGARVKASERTLSLSDESAAMICKGGREPVLGYKPKLIRSKNGFVVTVNLKEGNPADSAELEPVVREAIGLSGVIPRIVSADDGYASREGKQEIEQMGIEIVSISGSKGRRLTAPELWESETYREARHSRSAVESLMFTVKYRFGFGRVGRVGLAAVRAELLERVLVYNLIRIITQQRRSKKPQRDRAA